MQGILHLKISREGQTYTTEGVSAPLVTRGATFEELERNIHQAVELLFRREETSAGLSACPEVSALPTIAF